MLELSTDSTKLTKGLDDAKAGAKGIEGNFKAAGVEAKTFGAHLNDLGAATSKWASSHKQSFTAIGQAAGLLVGAAAASAAAIVMLGQRGADVDDVTSAFNRMNADGPKALAALQDGIGGLLTDYDLMKPLNAALSAGFQLNAADAYTMSRAAWVLADAQGKDLKESYDTIAQAMATGRVRALAALGVSVEQKGAAAALKQALDAEGEAVTSNAEKQANRQAAMEALNRVVLAAGEQELDFGEKLTRVKVQIGNMTDSLGVAIATSPVLGAAMTSVGDALQTAFGANQTATIQALVTAIGQVAIMAVQTATYVVAAATEMASAYYKTRAAVDTLFQAFNDREVARVEALVHTYEAIAATSTTATSQSKLRLQELRIELERLKGVSKGFDADANESLATQARLAAAGQQAQKALDEMIRSMKAAAAEQTSATAIASGLAKAHTDLGDGVHILTKAEKAQAEALKDILAAAIPLTAAQKATAVANEKLGVSAATTAEALNINADAVSTYLDSLKNIKEIADVWQKAHADMLDDSKKFINKWLADSTAARRKDMDASGAALADQLRLGAEYHEKRYQLTLKGAALELRQLQLQREAAIAELTKRFDIEGPLYQQSLAEITRYYDALAAKATDVWGALTATFADLPNTLMRAFEGGGGIAGALKSLAVQVGTDFGKAMSAAITAQLDLWGDQFTGSALSAKTAGFAAASGAFAAGSAAASGASTGKQVGAAARSAANIGMLAATSGASIGASIALATFTMGAGLAVVAAVKIYKAMNDGRKAMQDYYKTFAGGSDELRQRMLVLGDAGEKMWIQLTQKTGKGEKANAEALIKHINAALAAYENSPEAMAKATYQTTADLQAIADKAKQVYDYMLASGKYSAGELARAFEASKDAQIAALGDTAKAQADELATIKTKYDDLIGTLKSELSSFSASLQAEADAPEYDEMGNRIYGVVEMQQMARKKQIEDEMASLQAQSDAEIDAKQKTFDEMLNAGQAVALELRKIFGEPPLEIPYYFRPLNTPGGDYTMPPILPVLPGGSGGSAVNRAAVSSASSSRATVQNIHVMLDSRVLTSAVARGLPNELTIMGVGKR